MEDVEMKDDMNDVSQKYNNSTIIDDRRNRKRKII